MDRSRSRPVVLPISRRWLLLAALTPLAVPAGARAEDRLILGHELVQLLEGRSIRGTWNGRDYVQWFGPTGRTAYKPLGGLTEWGNWHLGDTGNYCARWEHGRLTCYQVILRDATYYWRPVKGGALQPFTLHEGNLVLSD